MEAGDDLFEIVGTGGDGAHSFNISTTSALVAAAGGLLVKLVARHLDDLHAVALGLAHDVLDHGIALHVVAHKDTAHGHAGTERLDDGALAFDVISHVMGPFGSAR